MPHRMLPVALILASTLALAVTAACTTGPRHQYAMGERVDTGDLYLTVTGFRRGAPDCPNGAVLGTQLEPDEELLMLQLTLENKRDEPVDFHMEGGAGSIIVGGTFDLMSQGKDIRTSRAYEETLEEERTLPPLGTYAGSLAFVAPAGFRELALVYRPRAAEIIDRWFQRLGQGELEAARDLGPEYVITLIEQGVVEANCP